MTTSDQTDKNTTPRATGTGSGARSGVAIRRASSADLSRIETLLAANDLPTVGVAGALDGFLVAEQESVLAGVAGVEACGEYGLLRSTAVSPEWRGQGFARRLVERAIAESEAAGVTALYLLTTTAERYFSAFGFATTTRDAVPDAVRATAEFQGACPASATVMVRVGSGGNSVA